MRRNRVTTGIFGLLVVLTFGFAASSATAAPISDSQPTLDHRVAADLATNGGTLVAPNVVDHHGYTATYLAPGAVATSYPSCSYRHLCVYTPSNNTVYDYYTCGYYDTNYLIGDGTFTNNQTPGTVAKFYNSNGTVRWTNRAYDQGTASWTYVYHIRPC